MVPKLKCHSNWNVTQIGISLMLKMSFRYECHSNWNVTQIRISQNFIDRQIGMSLKLEFHLN